jgi:SAM-dependent methyltransferase
MKNKKDRPVAQEAYDQMAEAYAKLVDTKPHNAYYERPATLSLLPDVNGKRVLDAGCGPGVYSEWLVNRGADVVSFDANPKMVQLAKERLGKRVLVRLADLSQPLDFLLNDSFEIVICPLVLDYVEDWVAVFQEFFRILKPGGVLVFSMEHPFAKYDDHRETSKYLDIELVEYEWTGFGSRVRVPSYRRPMSAVINPLITANFQLDRILEPEPTEAFKAQDPDDYEKLCRQPGFMCVRAVINSSERG